MNPPRRPEEARTRKNATFPPDIKGKTLVSSFWLHFSSANDGLSICFRDEKGVRIEMGKVVSETWPCLCSSYNVCFPL